MTDPLDVICIGEALVDFLPEAAGQRLRDVVSWRRCAGGSPANVAVGLARLGARAGFLGVVGRDEFGDFLLEALANEGVDVGRLRQTDEGKTGLCFISLDSNGERSFVDHRTRAAELFLGERDVDPVFLDRARAIHCGTNALLFREAQRALVKMVRAASTAGKLVCCDPNLRLHFWPDPQALRGVLDVVLPLSGVVKLAGDEIEFAVGTADPEAALESLARRGTVLPIVTLGAEGALFRWQDRVVRVSAPAAKVVDTTGAGDGFVAGLLYGLTREYADLAALRRAGVGELRELIGFACAVGTRVTEKLGAIDGLPRYAELGDAVPGLLRPRAG